MTPRTIRLADLSPEPTTVELGEHTYTLRQITRSVGASFDKTIKPLNELLSTPDEADSDKLVGVFGKAISIMLEPGDGAPDAGKVLLDAWKADGISIGQIRALFEGLQEASIARPT